MEELKMKKGEKALVIVAHPDDETIWMGGTILKNKQADWTVYSLCRASDADREPKFKRVCGHLGVRGLIDDLDDSGDSGMIEAAGEIAVLIAEKFKDSKFDYIFTHGANGEYGHAKHVGAHKAVRGLISSGQIKAKHVLFFNYQKNGTKEHPLVKAKNDSDIIIELSDEIWQEKRKIVAEMYGYPYDGLDVGYCTRVEGFKIHDRD
jgi:LmbE family N-acetylglucosaminyl deacetylase